MSLKTKTMLRYFRYQHLPSNLQEVSRGFAELANAIHEHQEASVDSTDQAELALTLLLQAKDAAVRAAL